MTPLVFFLEERSAEALLRTILPRLFPTGVSARYFTYSGKQDLLKNIRKDLLPYRGKEVHTIVLVDQDYADCVLLKAKLRALCAACGVSSIIRIACRELESWYLAQLDVVERAYALKNVSQRQNQKKFRNPDMLVTPDRHLRQITRKQYSKIQGSRHLGAMLHLDNRRSHSFAVFVDTLRHAVLSINPPQ